MSAIQTEHLALMKRAFRAAEKARGTCAPNPFVGAVVVKNGKVISEGWTQVYGGDHAEVQALIKAGKEARGADLYVTLEPCSHQGKTPPCALALIKAGIKRVYIGIEDPNPLVSGKGIKLLEEAGIRVEQGFCAEEITRQLEYYLCRILQQRPFVIWKAALSVDGKYAAQDGSSRWISGEKSRQHVQHLREEADVVLTGIGTVLCDDPLLNVRLAKPRKQPLRVILDADLKTPLNSQIVNTADRFPTRVFCARGKENYDQAKALLQKGVMVHPVTAIRDEVNLREVLGVLHQIGHYSILLECGSKLASSFFRARLVDKCLVFMGAKIVGGGKSMLSELSIPNILDAIDLAEVSYRKIGDDILISGYPRFP